MFKGTPKLVAKRREEIINACEQLYQTMSFKEITIKEISGVTSFSRPTIYNYFQTKEEIFLALFEREYDRWNEDLSALLENNEALYCCSIHLRSKFFQQFAYKVNGPAIGCFKGRKPFLSAISFHIKVIHG